MGTTRMDTTIPTATTDRIRTMVTIGLTIGTAGIAITGITDIITTMGTKLTWDLEIQIELAREQSRASLFF